MSTTGERALSWIELLVLMVHGPTTSLRGTIRSEAGGDAHHGRVGWMSYDRAVPVFANHRRAPHVPGPDTMPGMRVWRDGLRLRVQEPDGRVATMADDVTAWSFDDDHETPRARPRDELLFGGGAIELTQRRDASHWVGDDFTRPTGPVQQTTFLGRPAWAVELAPPPRKPHPMQLVVDAATGIVLQQRNDAFGSVHEWTEFVTGEAMDPSLFTWTGPSRTREAEHEAGLAAARAEEDRRREWFARHVTAAPLHVDVPLALQVHGFDDDGSFRAGLEVRLLGSVRRRPHSDVPWDRPGADDPGLRHWRHGDHDWAVHVYGSDVDARTVDAVAAALGRDG